MAVKFKNTININDQYTFPTVVGTDGQYLSITDAAAGTLDWTNIGDVDGLKSNFIYYDAKNSTGSTIPVGTAVMAVGTDGNSGHILIAPMVADGSVEPKYFIGVTDTAIDNGVIGKVVHFGTIDQVNTNAFSNGNVLWCDPATPGGFTTTEPAAPAVKLAAAIVINSSTNGKLLVRVQGNEGLHELHDVKLDNVSNGQALVWDEVGGYWKNIDASELVQASLTIEKNSFVGDGVEVDFVIDSAVIAESRTQVYIDGVYQSKENYSTSSQTVTFSEAPADGANIEIIHITTLSADISIDTFTGNGTTSVYTLSKAISGENNTQVYFDGVYQSKDNYTVSGSNITFSENVANGVDIEVVHLQPSVSQSIAFSGQVILYGGIADAYGGSGEDGQILSSSPAGIEWIDAPDLDGEIANRIAADDALQSDITDEATARIAADTLLQDNIDAEATTRASEDATLLSTINAEAVIRGTNDNTLQSNIDAEETARISADNTLQDNINIEAQSRASADAALQSSIDTINAKDIVLTINGDASGSTTFTNLTNATLTLAIVDDSHNHVISNIDGLQSALDLKANITYVDSAVANLVDSSPATLDTLNELAAALGDDPNFATTVSTQIGTAQSTADTALTNANAALAKDPTLTLSGDASGSATFTNLGNATLSVTIADDSHNHIISNIDGLQTALDGKQAAGTYNTIIGTDTDIDTSGATIVDNIYVTDGVITSMGTRTLTLGDLGYTGAANANNYVHPSYAGDDINVDTGALTGATVVSDIDFNITTDTLGHVTDANGVVSTRTLTLADLGYTGATNANYITNNNQLTNGAGYLTSVGNDSHWHSKVYIPDTRGAARLPSYYDDRYAQYDFQNTADTGAGGDTWHVLQTISPWSSYDPNHRQQQLVWTGTGGLKFRYATSDTAWASWQTLWTSGNDGSGSGLDADLLDGVQGSQFLRSDANDTFTGTLSWGGAGGATGIDMNNGDIAGLNWLLWDDDGEGLRYPGGETFYWSGSLWQFTGGYVQAQGSMRAPIFYDSDNTAYYLDPADGTTSANLLGDIKVNGGKIHIKRGVGLTTTIIEDDSTASGRGQLLLDSHYSDLIIASRNTNANKHGSSITLATQSTSTNDYAKWVIGQGQYQEGADELAFAYGTNFTNPHSVLGTDNANAAFRIFAASGGYTLSKGSSRAPIFYDSDNTGYYLNPAGKSRLGNIERLSHSTGYLVGSYNSVAANSAKTNPIYTIGDSYKPSDDSLSNMYGIGYTHGGNAPFVSLSGAASWGMYVAADGDARIFLDASGGVVVSTGSHRAPIFYDSNNTGYYTNPASTSNLNALNVITLTETSALRFKENIKEDIDASIVDKLRPVSYDWKQTKEKDYGFIAEEVNELDEDLVTKNSDGEMSAIKYTKLIPFLVKKIQEQEERIKQLENGKS